MANNHLSPQSSSPAWLPAALELYADALIRGLCRPGAIEVAAAAAEGVDPDILASELESAMLRPRAPSTIHIKRIYAVPAGSDGQRILVDRLWPRGLSRIRARLDAWLKALAPSDALREWYGHDPARWDEFQRRYHGELNAKPEHVAVLFGLIAQGDVTLLYAAKDEQRNNAVSLRNYVLKRA